MVAQLAAMPIVTAVGEFAAPYLLRKAGEIGLTRFIQVYGSAAAAAIGIQKTQPVDLQTEKILGMPVSHITGQGEVYDDIDYSYIDEDKENDEVPTKTTEEKLTEPTEPEPPGAVYEVSKFGTLPGDQPEVEEELKELSQPVGFPIKTWEKSYVDTGTEIPEPKKEEPPVNIPPQIKTEPEGLPIPEQKTWRDYVLTQDKPKDITKQTEELVSDIEEDDFDWGKSIENANKNYPKLQIQNLKKIVEADKHFGAAAMSFEGYEESQLIYLTPQEYLDLTKQFRRTDWDIKSESIKDLEKIISEGKELANIPTLYVKKEGDNYSVSGQEGGHRAQAFKNLGYNLIPTVIQGTGKDKVADIENKVYTATKRSYLYTEDWTQDHIGFIPKNIISKSNYNEDTKEYEDTEVKSVKPEDFYSVRSKKKLFVENDVTKQTEELVKKELSVSQQTKNLTSKIKNKITTWELLADTKEEFKKLAEENKISVEELEKGAIQKQIKFKKFGKHFDVYFNNKKIAELVNITQDLREDETSWRPKNINTYNLVYLTEGGYFDNGVETIDGIENAKNSTMQYISNDLMDETKSDKYALGFTSLREIFQEMEYNKKGEPISEYEREEKK
jgi:D-ribose pyranose/furanose isomerase RbsD